MRRAHAFMRRAREQASLCPPYVCFKPAIIMHPRLFDAEYLEKTIR
jgi:hypothetical protein